MRLSSAALVNESTRTAQLSFSSTAPVERWFGDEVLSHDPGAVDLSRLNSGGSLLFNHDMNDVLGVIESARLDPDGKCRAVVRFGRDDRGTWAMKQVADGVLSKVSFMYVVDRYLEGDNPETYIATSWTPFEISLVTIPADPSVGVGRSHPFLKATAMTQQHSQFEIDDQPLTRNQRQRAAREEREMADREIAALCQKHNLGPASRFIELGATVADVRQQALDQLLARGTKPVAALSNGGLGLTDREVRDFSIVKAIAAQLSGDWSKAGFERDAIAAASAQFSREMGREPRGLLIPQDVAIRGSWGGAQTRAPYQVGTAVQGGNLVETHLAADNFIEVLRNNAAVMSAGATVLSGLVGNIDVPRQTNATVAYWVAESGAVTEAEATFDKMPLRPKTIGALSKMSRLMLLQSTPAIEMLVRQDLLAQIALAIDLGAISGSGAANQPLGIVNTAGIGSVVGGANGSAVSLDNLVDLETACAVANSPDGRRAYFVNAKSAGSLKKLKATTNQYLWTTSSIGQRSGTPPTFNNYPVYSTNQLRSNLTKGTSSGVCSELLFGNMSELVIGMWGGLEILVNPYDSTGFTTGDVLIRAFQTCDVGVKHPASFALMSDALTP